jgi:tetratricopeptide (TPR) repeat protein
MRAFYLSLLCCVFLLVGGRNAFANSLQEIRITLEAGGYDLAVEQSSALGTVDGLTLAAEALNAKLLLGKAKRKTKTAKRAMKLAKAALELDPQNVEAQIQYALAYGFYGRHASSFKAWRKKLPQKIRTEIDKAAIMAPDDMRVQALLGAWHLNLLYRAGGFDVGKRYGANAQEGVAHFQNALMQNKNDIIIHSNFLMLQFALEPKARAAQTKFVLQMVILTKAPHNDAEREILNQMLGVYEGFEDGVALKRAKAFLDQ